MIAAVRTSSALRRAGLVLLVALAMLVRTAVPAGWMPVGGPDGFALAICTGTGPAGMDMAGGSGGHGQHGPAGTLTKECPYAALSFAMDRPDGPPIVPQRAPMPRLALGSFGLQQRARAAIAAPPPPKTGPPAPSFA